MQNFDLILNKVLFLTCPVSLQFGSIHIKSCKVERRETRLIYLDTCLIQEYPEAYQVIINIPGYTDQDAITVALESNELLVEGLKKKIATSDCLSRKLSMVREVLPCTLVKVE